MPLLGTDQQLASSMVQLVQAANVSQGLQPAVIQALATGMAQAIIAHFLVNAEVAPGIVVATSGGAGTTTTPGKLT
jgi:hypothetical protein